MIDLVWLIPALPLLGFLILVPFGKRLGEPVAGILATTMTAGSFIAVLGVFFALRDLPSAERSVDVVLFSWLPVGSFQVDVGFLVDPLSVTWALFLTAVATLIHLYSIGYMRGDPRYHQYFAYLNLFVFSMLMLVLGNNFLITFLGWEGVGACSYLLISFWFEKKENASAGKKAFVTNRIGDWGFLVAMFLVFTTFGSLTYSEVLPQAAGLASGTAAAIALLFFVGAVGKSAQLPLFVWLPDAMAGPTPVSALIHAATMVTAGVYLMVRINPILVASPAEIGLIIAWVGAITALVAASIAVAQNDIKKVLAYSTISQLGFMFLAIGVGAYVAAVFHVITHAFFKSLLFLGSGSVIHGMDDDQDMRRMGALRKWMPITYGTFLIGWLALAGFPPLAGFWSKDEILVFGFAETWMLYAIALLAALLTAVYATRQFVMVFHGEARWGANAEADAIGETDEIDEIDVAGEAGSKADEVAGAAGADDADAGVLVAERTGGSDPDFHPHESHWLMWLPLVVLAVLVVFAGGLNLPFSDDLQALENWLRPSVPYEQELTVTGGSQWLLATLAALTAVVGIVGAWVFYSRRKASDPQVEPVVLQKGWYIDWFYGRTVAGPGTALFNAMAWFDSHIIDGAVNGIGWTARKTGAAFGTVQNGLVRSYALLVGAGAVLLMAFVLLRMSY